MFAEISWEHTVSEVLVFLSILGLYLKSRTEAIKAELARKNLKEGLEENTKLTKEGVNHQEKVQEEVKKELKTTADNLAIHVAKTVAENREQINGRMTELIKASKDEGREEVRKELKKEEATEQPPDPKHGITKHKHN